MTLRHRIDQLFAEPAVGDLGYPADQAAVATLVMGLKLLADAMDEAEQRLGAPHQADGSVTAADLTSNLEVLTAQVEELTAQVKKLSKSLKKLARKEKERSPGTLE